MVVVRHWRLEKKTHVTCRLHIPHASPAFLGYIFTRRLYTAHLYRYPFKLKVSRHFVLFLSHVVGVVGLCVGRKKTGFSFKTSHLCFLSRFFGGDRGCP